MRNEHLFFSTLVSLPRNADHTAGVFKEINVIAADISEKFSQHFEDETIYTDRWVTKKLAYQVFQKSIIEFVNNAAQKNATTLDCRVHIDTENYTMEISILDNGDGLSQNVKDGSYDWQHALKNPSEKAGGSDKSGGQHLALAISAYLLQKQRGRLELCKNFPRGATVILSSSLDDAVDEFAQYSNPEIKEKSILVTMLKDHLISSNLMPSIALLFKNQPNYNTDKDTLLKDASCANEELVAIENATHSEALRHAVYVTHHLIQQKVITYLSTRAPKTKSPQFLQSEAPTLISEKEVLARIEEKQKNIAAARRQQLFNELPYTQSTENNTLNLEKPPNRFKPPI